ncbi:hypothetical protein, partial [Roseovarius sp.]|uniref:hypothetical protein n=1 Tax=Roseovarius sp. TaxID=1486281 RepID=UPI0035665750
APFGREGSSCQLVARGRKNIGSARTIKLQQPAQTGLSLSDSKLHRSVTEPAIRVACSISRL